MYRSNSHFESVTRRPGLVVLTLLFAGVFAVGCNGPMPSAQWLANGLIDPTQTGNFSGPLRIEIRDAVSILDEPFGIQDADEPTEEDLEVRFVNPKIGAGDFLRVTIFELLAPNITTEQQFQVGANGYETFPVLGPVQIAGLTSRELELELKSRLREGGILDNAEVQVTVLRYESQQYSIIGGVVQPGNFPLPRPDYRLLNAMAAAGGLSPQADTVIVIRRGARAFGDQPATQPGNGDASLNGGASAEYVPFTMSDVTPTGAASAGQPPTTRPAPINELEILERGPQKKGDDLTPVLDPETGEWILKQPDEAQTAENGASRGLEPGTATAPADDGLLDGDLASEVRVLEIPAKALRQGDARYNIVIRPGDLIDVPIGEIGEFYVYGNIQRPGAYQLTGRRVTVKQAIASAGGFSPLAWPSRADLIRRVNKDEEQFIQIDLDAIFAGKAPDFYLRPNDMVNVGSSPISTFLAVARNAFRFSYGFGFVYDRNFADSDAFFAREQVKQRKNQERIQRGLPF